MIISSRTRAEVRGEYEDYSVQVFDVTWYGIVSDEVQFNPLAPEFSFKF
jgi:hypothetical protein